MLLFVFQLLPGFLDEKISLDLLVVDEQVALGGCNFHRVSWRRLLGHSEEDLTLFGIFAFKYALKGLVSVIYYIVDMVDIHASILEDWPFFIVWQFHWLPLVAFLWYDKVLLESNRAFCTSKTAFDLWTLGISSLVASGTFTTVRNLLFLLGYWCLFLNIFAHIWIKWAKWRDIWQQIIVCVSHIDLNSFLVAT